MDVPDDTPDVIKEKFAEAISCKEISSDAAGMMARKVLELVLDDQYKGVTGYPADKPGGLKIKFAKAQDPLLSKKDSLIDNCMTIINKYGNKAVHTVDFTKDDVDDIIKCDAFLIDYFYGIKIRLNSKANTK